MPQDSVLLRLSGAAALRLARRMSAPLGLPKADIRAKIMQRKDVLFEPNTHSSTTTITKERI